MTDIWEIIRILLGGLIALFGVITALYVWGRIFLPELGLTAPSWGTWFLSLFMPLLVAGAFSVVAAGVAGKAGR